MMVSKLRKFYFLVGVFSGAVATALIEAVNFKIMYEIQKYSIFKEAYQNNAEEYSSQSFEKFAFKFIDSIFYCSDINLIGY